MSRRFIWLPLAAVTLAHADYVYDGDAERWGRVVTSSGADLVFDVACDASRRVALKKDRVVRMELNRDCAARAIAQYASGVEDCDKPIKGFVAIVEGLATKPFVQDFELGADGRIVLHAHDGSVLLVEQAKLKSLTVTLKCAPAQAAEQLTPGLLADGVCFEPRQWAVNFTGKPVSRNQLFTQGFTVYVAGLGEPASGAVDARQAFGHAMTMWMSALLRIRGELEPELKAFVEQSFRCGATACMLTPPQVVRRYCQPSAMFLLRWVEQPGDGFGPDEKNLLARAQVQGRTLLINAADHRFDVALGRAPRLDGGKYNLISILTHELGHAFGLPDIYDGSPSIMSASVRTMSNEPTDADARQLARILLREIKGSPPGEINIANCAGLRAD